jgi:hypothetical protein
MARARGFKWDNVQKKQFVVDSNGVETTLLDETGSGGGSETASIATSTTSPSNPVDGDLWFDTTDGTMYVYYDDGTSSQWVGISGATGATGATGTGGGVTIYADITARNAATGVNEGDIAFVSDSDTLYVYDSSEWIRILAGPDELPRWTTELSSAIVLNADGTATTLTVAATDPDGFDIKYTYDTSPSNQTQATIVNNNDGTFTLTPSITETDAGSFTFRAKATDGIHVISTTTTAALNFANDITFSGSEPGINVSSTNSFSYITADGTTGNSDGLQGARSSELVSGRKYFEVEITYVDVFWKSFMIGVARSDESLTGYNAPGSIMLYALNSAWYGNGGTGPTNANLDTITTNDVLQIAYDNTTDEVWFNKNNGTWWPNDPGAGGSGKEMPGTSGQTYNFVLGSGGSSDFSGNIITGSQSFNYSVPNGFSGH